MSQWRGVPGTSPDSGGFVWDTGHTGGTLDSWLAWERLGILPEQLEQGVGESEV